MEVAPGCNICFVHMKNCSSDCVTYTLYSAGYIGSEQYAHHGRSPYDVCKIRCTNDPVCNGFIHNAVTRACILVDSSIPIPYPTNTDFSFSRKECDIGCTHYFAYENEYILSWESYYDVLNDTNEKECELRCNNDSNCRGYAVKANEQLCGLAFAAREQDVGVCVTCSAFSKQCPVGEFKRDRTSLEDEVGSGIPLDATDEGMCKTVWDLVYSDRRIQVEAQALGISHGNYPVDRISCSASTYTTYSRHREAASTFSVFNSSYDDCQDSCTKDSFCQGFAYNSKTHTCALSESSLPKFINCAVCSFAAKECSNRRNVFVFRLDRSSNYSIQCSSVFSVVGLKMIVSTEYKSYNKTNFATCEKLCVEDPKCISLHHNSENNECQLSKSSVSAPSACENCTYYVRHCLPDCIIEGFGRFYWYFSLTLACSSVAYEIHDFGYIMETTRADAGQNVSFEKCQHLCNNDTFCFGFAFKSDTGRCVLSDSSHPTWYPSDITCSFSKKLCLPVQLAIEEIVTNGTVKCVCVCTETNKTLGEIMSQRKKALTVDTENLSSTTRKFISAPDFRMTSQAIGAVGASILGCVMAAIVLPDLCVTAYYVIHMINKCIRKIST
ncbi:uncharacterized protein LOC125674516 [Ostrea edulis]|uniref:uncharacterized protein LOC125674516 n=1 Tax=Ostrea edulis TaxID=37623 RepID=UPI0024AF5147|nr:uncharacterized protein LOC125674516 [Ostrea edulis]